MNEKEAQNYYGLHRNKPALLLGNGPSLNLLKDYDKNLLASKFICIGMNRSWQVMTTKYHCIMFHYEHLEELKKGKWDTSKTTLWTYKHYSELYTREVNKGDVVYVPSVANPDNEMHKYNLAGMISQDVGDGSFADMTGHFALEVALYMKCTPIYLIGFDLYGGHFCDNWSPLDDWQEIQLEMFESTAQQIEVDFPWASVYNLNAESKLESFAKVEPEDIFNG